MSGSRFGRFGVPDDLMARLARTGIVVPPPFQAAVSILHTHLTVAV